jgi:phage tail-like protein
MAEFSVNTHRFDPYKNFKFRVKWDGKYVAGVSKVSALKRTTELVNHREGGDPSSDRISPGRSKYEPVTLERGITFDPEFRNWADLVFNTDGDAAVSLKNFRKDIIVELMNLSGQIVKRYTLFRCWVSEIEMLPELDSNANAVAIERVTVQTEGIAMDADLQEPMEL